LHESMVPCLMSMVPCLMSQDIQDTDVPGNTDGVGELHESPEDPDRADEPEPVALGVGGEVAAGQARFERRSRSEYAAELAQRAVSGWEQRPFTSRIENPAGPATPDDPLEAVRHLEPKRAGLPDVRADDAAAYIDTHVGERPWLAAARERSPDVQRLFVALDQGGGHAHIRHEGWVTEEMNERRVAYLEDPAQSDPAKRAAGIDGLKEGDRPHQCRQTAARIIDPDAFAVAITRGLEHPKIRAALEMPFDPDEKPSPVQLPIAELLGPDGHRYCTGWRLEPVNGSMNAARRSREAWIAATDQERASGLTKPTARPVETFEGGTALFAFGHLHGGGGYEVVTMYPRPPEREG
jgi:hypothetical protein